MSLASSVCVALYFVIWGHVFGWLNLGQVRGVAHIASVVAADRAAIERTYLATGQYEPEELFERLLAIMAEAIEQANPPDGPFAPVELELKYKGRKGVLRFAPSPNHADLRYVGS